MSDKGGGEEGEVVMRKQPKAVNVEEKARSKVLEQLKDGDKRVKWSESTDLREKMKEYRRSQLSMSLDYHHIIAEEERERTGVKLWRDSLQKGQMAELEEALDGAANEEKAHDRTDDGEDDSSGIESDEFNPAGDEDLELRLRAIKATTTKHTLLPAYRAAVEAYKPLLGDTSLSADEKKRCQTQCDLYSQVVSLYDKWPPSHSPAQIDTRYDKISSLLQQAKALEEPPPSVAKVIFEALTCPDNLKKQSELHGQLVNETVTTSVQV